MFMSRLYESILHGNENNGMAKALLELLNSSSMLAERLHAIIMT